MRRVTTVERRDAGKWMRNGPERRPQLHDSGGHASVSRRRTGPAGLRETLGLARAQVAAAPLGGASRLARVCAPWAAVLGRSAGVGAGNRILRTRSPMSRMREIRPSGPEGGARFNPWSLALSTIIHSTAMPSSTWTKSSVAWVSAAPPSPEPV